MSELMVVGRRGFLVRSKRMGQPNFTWIRELGGVWAQRPRAEAVALEAMTSPMYTGGQLHVLGLNQSLEFVDAARAVDPLLRVQALERRWFGMLGHDEATVALEILSELHCPGTLRGWLSPWVWTVLQGAIG